MTERDLVDSAVKVLHLKPGTATVRSFDHRLFFGDLSKKGWLSKLPKDFQFRLASLGRWITLDRGQRLFSHGDTADGFFGISEGLCDLSVPVSDDVDCVFYRAKAGFWCDDGALTEGAPRQISVEALEPSRIFYVEYAVLRKHLRELPDDWFHIHKMTVDNMIQNATNLSEVLSLPARERILRLLLRLADKHGSISATQEELGRLAGVSRATTRRSLSDLIASGVLTTNYGRLAITDRRTFEQLVYNPDFTLDDAEQA